MIYKLKYYKFIKLLIINKDQIILKEFKIQKLKNKKSKNN